MDLCFSFPSLERDLYLEEAHHKGGGVLDVLHWCPIADFSRTPAARIFGRCIDFKMRFIRL